MDSYKSRKEKKRGVFKWFITISIITFLSSLIFSYISTNAITNMNVISAIMILILVILVGIIFDIIAVAVTVGEEEEFHAKASKKIPGAKVSSVCADVIGDICGVLSGAISAIITLKITSEFNFEFDVQAMLSALVAALTVGGKAVGKVIAQMKSTEIVNFVAKILNIFNRKK